VNSKSSCGGLIIRSAPPRRHTATIAQALRYPTSGQHKRNPGHVQPTCVLPQNLRIFPESPLTFPVTTLY